MRIPVCLSFLFVTLTVQAAGDAPVASAPDAATPPAAIAPPTSPTPFALVDVTLAQINAASPYFLIDGKEPEYLTTPPAKLADLQVLQLWPGQAPLQQGDSARDMPTLTVYLPLAGKATGAAMIIIPGGAYSHVSPREGIPAGQWAAKNGIAAFILNYRVAPYHYPAETDDGIRAIRYVRANAAAWGLDPNRIGIIGFSAGGHLASFLATNFDKGDPSSTDPIERVSSRPDLQILLYPVVTMMDGDIVHAPSRSSLLGRDFTPEIQEKLSSERHVSADTPPALVVLSTEDTTVNLSNGGQYVDALIKNKIPFVFIREPMGKHGFGIIDAWSIQGMAWLRTQKF